MTNTQPCLAYLLLFIELNIWLTKRVIVDKLLEHPEVENELIERIHMVKNTFLEHSCEITADDILVNLENVDKAALSSRCFNIEEYAS